MRKGYRAVCLFLSALLLLSTGCQKRVRLDAETSSYQQNVESNAESTSYPQNVNQDTQTVLQTEPDTEKEQMNVPTTEGSDVPLVVDAFAHYGIRNEGGTNIFRIPKLTLTGSHAEQTNAKILEELGGIYDSIENKEGDCGVSRLTYAWAQTPNVVSILVQWMPEDYTGHGSTYYKSYHASTHTGELLSLAQLLQEYQLTKDEYYALVREILKATYTRINSDVKEYFPAEYDDGMKRLLSDKNVFGATPFISSAGDLCFAADMYYVGTFEVCQTFFNLTGEEHPHMPDSSFTVPQEETAVPDVTLPTKPSSSVIVPDITDELLIGHWSVDGEYTMSQNTMSLTEAFGRPYHDSMIFGSQNSFKYYITYYGGSGRYQIDGNNITYEVTTENGKEVNSITVQEVEGTLYLVHTIKNYTLYWKKT